MGFPGGGIMACVGTLNPLAGQNGNITNVPYILTASVQPVL